MEKKLWRTSDIADGLSDIGHMRKNQLDDQNIQDTRTMCLVENNGPMHLSHLHDYVSAYVRSTITLADLELRVAEAFLRLRTVGVGSELVDLDGEMSLQCCAGGQIILLLPWKRFDAVMELPYPRGRVKVEELSVDDMTHVRDVMAERYNKLTAPSFSERD